MKYKIDLPGDSAAILIDCWEADRPENVTIREELMSNIESALRNIRDLKFVGLASYDTQEYSKLALPHVRNSQWYRNAKDLFCKKHQVRWVQDLYLAGTPAADAKTHPKLIDLKLENVFQIAMFGDWQLEYLIRHRFPNIRNIFLFGLSWEICLQSRPLGWIAISKLILNRHIRSDVGIYTVKDCVLAMDPITGVDCWNTFKQEQHWVNAGKSLWKLDYTFR
jgi:hypothetical protein